MVSLIRSLIRPYRWTLFVILVAMLVQTAMSVAAPWPLKIVLDNVLGSHRLSPWIRDLIPGIVNRGNKMDIAIIAALATILIAVINAVASYVANYCTTSVGQWVANDLRIRVRQHWNVNPAAFRNAIATDGLSRQPDRDAAPPTSHCKDGASLQLATNRFGTRE